MTDHPGEGLREKIAEIVWNNMCDRAEDDPPGLDDARFAAEEILAITTPPASAVTELVEALEDIANPLRVLQREADARGNRLNGHAYSIANNLGFVQSIARAALTKARGH